MFDNPGVLLHKVIKSRLHSSKISSAERKRLSGASRCVTLSTSADQVWTLTSLTVDVNFSEHLQRFSPMLTLKSRFLNSWPWKQQLAKIVTPPYLFSSCWRCSQKGISLQHSLRTIFATKTYSMYEPRVADLDSHWASFPGLSAVPPLRFSYTQDGWLDLKEIMGLHLVNPG